MKTNIIKSDKKHESGFTLIEVMVALAIFSIVIVGVIEVFVNSNKSYMMQDDIATMQQNIRIAKMFIERDIRMADESFVFQNGVGEGSSDKLTIGYVESIDNFCGDDPDDSDGVDRPCSSLPNLTLNGFMPANSAQARVFGNLAQWDSGCYCGGTTYNSPGFGFQAEITTPGGVTPAVSDTFFVTQVQDNSNNMIQNRPIQINGVQQPNTIVNAYPDRSIIRFFIPESRTTTNYEIKNGELLRGGQVIADNVEDLQFAFCGDFDGDGIVDPANDDDWFSDALDGGDLPAASKPIVRFVRITLLGRTAKEHGISSIRPTIEDHAEASENDKFNRRLLQTTVQMRNASLQ